MRLSKLQKYLLDVCFDKRYGKIDRDLFLKYYSHFARQTKKKDRVDAISKSLERLIKSGLMVGFGEMTQNKIYIHKVRLTGVGRKAIRRLLGEQRRLPL